MKSTPPALTSTRPTGLARKLHEQINGDVEVVARPTPAAARKASREAAEDEGPWRRDGAKKQRTGLFDFLSKKAKSLRIVDVVPNPQRTKGAIRRLCKLREDKKVKLLFPAPPQNIPTFWPTGWTPTAKRVDRGSGSASACPGTTPRVPRSTAVGAR